MNHFRITFFLLLVFVHSEIWAQSDTVFLDRFGIQTSIKQHALTYRLTSKNGDFYVAREYDFAGNLIVEGQYSSLYPEVKEGSFKYYRKSGKIDIEGSYAKNAKEGEWKAYHPSGELYMVENYSNGELNGDLFGYYPNGKFKRKDKYVAGKFISGTCYSLKGKKIKHFLYWEPASFQGGKSQMIQFLKDHLVYPQEAQDMAIEGRVYIRFVVNISGEISEVTVIRSVDPILDENAVNIVKSMPKWVPGKIDGVLVKSYFDLPINYQLN